MQPLQICIGPIIRIGRESWCLPYAGFFLNGLKININLIIRQNFFVCPLCHCDNFIIKNNFVMAHTKRAPCARLIYSVSSYFTKSENTNITVLKTFVEYFSVSNLKSGGQVTTLCWCSVTKKHHTIVGYYTRIAPNRSAKCLDLE